jgi:hypothetical protein
MTLHHPWLLIPYTLGLLCIALYSSTVWTRQIGQVRTLHAFAVCALGWAVTLALCVVGYTLPFYVLIDHWLS